MREPTTAAAALLLTSPLCFSQEPPAEEQIKTIRQAAEEQVLQERGLTLSEEGACPGYTLISPLRSKSAYLVDMDGECVHEWKTDLSPGNSVYLMDDGSLLRCGRDEDNPRFHGGGQGGYVQLFSWEGELLWNLDYSDEQHMHHHDIEPLPNGNVLLIAWEYKSAEEALAAGRATEATGAEEGLWPDMVVEIRPTPPTGGEVVWEWHAWDHLVQENDPSKAGFGEVSKHPHRIDVNAGLMPLQRSQAERKRQAQLEAQMRALGYLGDDDEDEEGDEEKDDGRRSRAGDWLHTNGIDYHPGLDLIALSLRSLSEVWIIDHSTTSAEAATSSGGRHGRGGDLLYRWGNPENYGRGGPRERRLWVQHDARFVHDTPEGELRLTVFNNGEGRRGGTSYSSADELLLPFREGRFELAEGQPFGPVEAAWSYVAPEATDFFSSFISGVQRLANGNTLICSGANGRVFEVTPEKSIVWEYLNPLGEVEQEEEQGGPAGDRPDRRGPPGADGRRRPDGPPPGADGPRRRAGPPPGTDAPRRPDGPPPGARRRGPPDGPGRGADGPPDGRGGPPRRGGGGRNPHGLFRATRLPADHPGLSRLGDG